jgi:excisionase family DNA binding protein
MHVTLGEAARQSGISKSTLSRAIKDGKLSAVRSVDTGSYKIEQSELARYLEATAVIRATVEKPAETGAATQATTPPERYATAALEAEIAGLKQVAELLREQLDDMKGQRDRWQQQAERLALAAPKPEPAPSASHQLTQPDAQPAPELSRLRRAWRWMRATG